MYEFERYDLSRVDYVFTTVPLQTATAVPIYQIGNFLDASDVRRSAGSWNWAASTS